MNVSSPAEINMSEEKGPESAGLLKISKITAKPAP